MKRSEIRGSSQRQRQGPGLRASGVPSGLRVPVRSPDQAKRNPGTDLSPQRSAPAKAAALPDGSGVLESGAPAWPNGFDIAPEWLRPEMEKAGELRRDAAA
jgi:hypothetical protein